MNATDAVRSGEAAGRLVFGSRNENTNRLGPGTWRELTMTGITLAVAAFADGAGPVTEERGATGGAQPQAATRRLAVSGEHEDGRAAHDREAPA